MGARDVADRARHRGDADPDPPPDRDGAAGAGEPGGVRRPVHARPRPVAPLDRHRHARPPVRAAGPPRAELPRGPERRVRRPGPGRRRERRLPRAQPARRHRHRPDADPPRRARAGDAPHRRRAGVGNDSLDGRRARDRRARAPAHHEGRGGARAGPRRASSPASPSCCARNDEVDGARAWANQALGHAEYSPNYMRLLEHGDATDVGDLCAAGDESAVVDRLRSFRDAGVTDLASGCCRSGATATRASSRATARSRCSRRCVPSSEPRLAITRRS